MNSANGLAEFTNVGSRSYPLPSLAPAAYSLGGLGRNRSTKALEEASAQRGWGKRPDVVFAAGACSAGRAVPQQSRAGCAAAPNVGTAARPERTSCAGLARDERGIGDDHPDKPRAYQMAPTLRDAAREVAAGKTLPIHGWTP